MIDFIDRFEIEGPRTRPGIHLGDTAGLLRVMRLAAHLERQLAATSAVKPGQFQVLAALRRRDPLPMNAGELAEAALLTTGAMTAVLDRLEEQGLIRREMDAKDRRPGASPSPRRGAPSSTARSISGWRSIAHSTRFSPWKSARRYPTSCASC